MSAFVTSDLHLGHEKILTFFAPDGSPVRPFDSVQEMHETIRDNWNRKVRKRDRVYVLGDVAMRRECLKLLDEMNGSKVLVKGNHDSFKPDVYLRHFVDVRGAMYRDGLIFTHIPVHPSCLSHRYYGNVHGHLHCHLIHTPDGKEDKKYFNACLERNDFAPVALEDIRCYFNL